MFPTVRYPLFASVVAIATVLFLAGSANAQIRMVELDENTQQVTIRNFSATETTNISSWQLCRQPGTYQALSVLAIIGGGDLNLSPGEEVTVVYTAILAAGTGIGLYISSPFSSSTTIRDYMQYKGVVGFRQSVAVGAGIWTANTFASGDPGPYFYTGDGIQNGASFWTSTPSAVPGLDPGLQWVLIVLMILLSSVQVHLNRGAASA